MVDLQFKYPITVSSIVSQWVKGQGARLAAWSRSLGVGAFELVLHMGCSWHVAQGMFTSALLSWACCRVLRIVEANNEVSLLFWTTKMLPVGFFMAGTLWTGNEVCALWCTVPRAGVNISMFVTTSGSLSVGHRQLTNNQGRFTRPLLASTKCPAGQVISSRGPVCRCGQYLMRG